MVDCKQNLQESESVLIKRAIAAKIGVEQTTVWRNTQGAPLIQLTLIVTGLFTVWMITQRLY